MATITELLESRQSLTAGGRNTGVRSFVVYDTASPITTDIAVRQLFGTGGLPQKGEQYPDAVSPFVAADVSVDRYEGQSDVWKVTWTYKDGAVGGGTNETRQPNDPGYVDVSITGSAEFDEVWRSLTNAEIAALVAGANYPNGTASAGDWDIGGTKIDVAGEPLSGPLRKKVTLSVTETMDFVPAMSFFMGYVGRRNSTPFKGGAIGTIVYTAPSIKRIDLNRWAVTHNFVSDNYYHMIQMAYRNPDGSVALDTDGHASNVWYRQPFPDLIDFYTISSYFTSSGLV